MPLAGSVEASLSKAKVGPMRPLGFELPVPMILFEGLLVAFAVTEAVIRLRSGTNQSGAKREWASFFVIVVGLAVAEGILGQRGKVPSKKAVAPASTSSATSE